MMLGVSELESELIEIHSSGPVWRRLPWARTASQPTVCGLDNCPLKVDSMEVRTSLLRGTLDSRNDRF
jgi:hypothetical protein